MKQQLVSLCLLMSYLFLCPACASAGSSARPDLVREVLDGKRQVAMASWWGFSAEDSTNCLQSAINSRVKRLIIDLQSSPWVTRPLAGVSNQEIVFQAGTQLVALNGAFHGREDCLLSFKECENIIIRGEKRDGGRSTHIVMQKKDYQSGAYEPSEWRHGISLSGCRSVLIQDLSIEKTGGDGIYLGASSKTGADRNVVIRRVDCNDNHRQGISVISAENILIDDCRMRNTKGTDPQAGIDFEPNSPTDILVNCVLRGCVSEGNAGTGYQICPQQMNSKSKPISITLDHCVSRSNSLHGIHFCSAQNDQPTGQLCISHFLSENDGMAGLAVQFNPFDAVSIQMDDSTIRNAARKDDFFASIYLQGGGADARPTGNVHFNRVKVEDDTDRPIIRIRSSKTEDITGSIVLKRNGIQKNINLSDIPSGNSKFIRTD